MLLLEVAIPFFAVSSAGTDIREEGIISLYCLMRLLLYTCKNNAFQYDRYGPLQWAFGGWGGFCTRRVWVPPPGQNDRHV